MDVCTYKCPTLNIPGAKLSCHKDYVLDRCNMILLGKSKILPDGGIYPVWPTSTSEKWCHGWSICGVPTFGDSGAPIVDKDGNVMGVLVQSSCSPVDPKVDFVGIWHFQVSKNSQSPGK